jgi:fatty acid desaturase
MTSAGPSIERSDLKALMARRNGPGLLRFALQSVLFLVSGAATIHYGAAGNPIWIPSVIACGIAVLAFFPSLHEGGHQTAFRTSWLNEGATWISALMMLQVPSFFRSFHWEHHRRTQDPDRDPEIASAPDLLDDWPANLAVYLLNACGQTLLVGKASFTLGCAFLPRALWIRVFPFIESVDARTTRRLAWESRGAVLVVGVGSYLAWISIPGFAYLLLAWPIAHLLLGLYLMPEHTGLGHEGTQLERTRTVKSNALVRWWMWNMPYHAEHHAHPGVPFHAVPELHARYADELPNLSPGYLAFHGEALRRAIAGRAPDVVTEPEAGA